MTEQNPDAGTAGMVALITGANKGIGLETARQLGQRGYTVVIGARDKARGEAAAEALRSEGSDAHNVVLDVTDPASAMAAADWLGDRFARLDVLVNNAGVLFESATHASSVTLDILRRTYETNAFGVVTVTNAMLPRLRESQAGRIVSVSSRLSRCGWMMSDDYPVALLAYNSSKAALNAITLHYARELRDTPIKVSIADPGHASTDINNNIPGPPASEAARIVVALATLPDDAPTGQFRSLEGAVAW